MFWLVPRMDVQVQDLYLDKESQILQGNLNIKEAKLNILYTISLTLSNKLQIGKHIHQRTVSKSTLVQFIKVKNEQEMPEKVCENISVHDFNDELEQFTIDLPSQLPTLRSFDYGHFAKSTTEINVLCFTSEDGLLAKKSFEINLFNFHKTDCESKSEYVFHIYKLYSMLKMSL